MVLWSGSEPGLLKNNTDIPTLADRIDSRMLIGWRDCVRARSWKEKTVYLRDAVQAGVEERQILRNSDATIVVGDSDARALRYLSKKDTVHVVSNGVVPANVHYLGREAPEPSVMFSGVMSYPPNVEAVCYFVEMVWPIVYQQVEGARFSVVGKSPISQVQQLGDKPGVEVVGEVDDMAETLADAWICVAPMRSGAGIKNKILEACALGKPVVMTPLASNGLDADLCDNAIVSSNAKDMAEAIVKLLRSSELRSDMGNKLRTYVDRKYSWHEKGQQFVKIVKSIIKTSELDRREQTNRSK